MHEIETRRVKPSTALLIAGLVVLFGMLAYTVHVKSESSDQMGALVAMQALALKKSDALEACLSQAESQSRAHQEQVEKLTDSLAATNGRLLVVTKLNDELTAELNRNRRAGNDLESVSAALREANAQIALLRERLKVAEAELLRLRESKKDIQSPAPNYRVL